jgi:hypothetical protein
VPFLRVIRDRRGYETTYLMDWYRDGSRQRSRVLYAFRTPGGTRVGRSALDPDTRREIEAIYSNIQFDWDEVVASQQVVESAADVRHPRKRRKAPGEDEVAVPESPRPDVRPVTKTAEAVPSRMPVPSVVEGKTPDEQTAFLSHWYAVIKARIPQRTRDPVRVQALTALAERLNPAPWTDADDITSGLENAAEALARLSRVFAGRRRRARRGSRGGAGPRGSNSTRAPEPASREGLAPPLPSSEA